MRYQPRVTKGRRKDSYGNFYRVRRNKYGEVFRLYNDGTAIQWNKKRRKWGGF